MSLARYSKRRDKNESMIIDALRMRGAHVDKLDRPVDLLVGYRGETVLIEVKGPSGKVTAEQQEWLETWPGGRRCVLRTIDDAHALLEDIDHTRRPRYLDG